MQTQAAPDLNSPFASVIGLGAWQSEHRPPAFNRWATVITSGLLILGGPILVLVGAYIFFEAYSRSGLLRANDSGFWLPALCGIAAVPIGLFMLFQQWRNWPLAVALYEGGFAYNDRNGLKQIRWNDIDAVWQSITKHYRNGIYTGTTYIYTVQLNDKTRMVLDNKFSGIEALGKAVTVGSTNAVFPRYVAALNAGQRLTFGPLALDVNGLYAGNKSLAWKEIKAFKINQGIISVRKEGGWFNWTTVTVPQVPNFWIFLELVSRFTKVE